LNSTVHNSVGRGIREIEEFSGKYEYGSDYSIFVEGMAKLISENLDAGMTAIFMDSGRAFTLDAIYGAESGNELKLSVLGGGNFEELLRSTEDFMKLDSEMKFKTTENRDVCLLCLEAGFNFIIPLKLDEKPVGMIFTESMDAVQFKGKRGVRLREVLSDLSTQLRMGKLNLILELESRRKNAMLGLAEKLSSLIDTEELLKTILDYLVGVVDYDAAGIFLVKSKSGKIWNRYQVGYDRERLKEVDLKIGKGVIGMSIEQKKAILIPDVSRESRYIAARSETGSEICVPLIRGEKVIGAFNVEKDNTYAYGFDDLEMLTGVANIAAVAIENSRLFKIYKENEEIERDLTIAADIQRALLPDILPEVEGVEIAASTLPSKSVGGDLYDVSKFVSGRLSIAIGDVSGKGVPAAILMANLYASYKGLARANLPAEVLMGNLNQLIHDNTEPDRYATFFYAIYDPEEEWLAYCNGGHNPPILLRKGGDVEYLKTGGPAIGFVTDKEYHSSRVDLFSGDRLLFYTDGVTEAANRKGEFYGEERLKELAVKSRNESATAMHDEIMRDIASYTKGVPERSDDITLVILRIL